MKSHLVPDYSDVRDAHALIASGLRATPCAVSAPLSAVCGMEIIAKHDYLQATGSFKERGARNALLSLPVAVRERGVIAASAGNHALGLAWHGRELGAPVTVVMPKNAPRVKAGRCHTLGAKVVLHGDTFDEAEKHARALCDEHGLTYVHPFDDAAVIAGQGTVGLEMLYAFPEVDAVVLPVGGGGLLAGVAAAVKALKPSLRVIGVEPAHAASLAAGLAAGRVVATPTLATIADGLAVKCTGGLTLAAAQRWVDRVVTVSEDEIVTAMLALEEWEDVTVEGAGAVALAALLAGRLPELNGKKVGIVLSGANVDASTHARAVRRARAAREMAPSSSE